MGERSIRFAVTDGSGLRAVTWKCWTTTNVGKSDVYLTCRELGGSHKASLHQSGSWRIAFDNRFFNENVIDSTHKTRGRYITEWTRPRELAPGLTLAFRIITPYSSVNIPVVSLDARIVRIPKPPHGCAVEVAIFITVSGALVSSWPGRNFMNTKLVGSVSLDSGETVWVVYMVIDIPDFKEAQGKLSFFKGRSKKDLSEKGLHALAVGKEKDGSRYIVDFAIGSINVK